MNNLLLVEYFNILYLIPPVKKETIVKILCNTNYPRHLYKEISKILGSMVPFSLRLILTEVKLLTGFTIESGKIFDRLIFSIEKVYISTTVR